MKSDKFQEAKGNLTFTQKLMDNFQAPQNMAQQGPATAPMAAPASTPQPQQTTPDIATAVKDAMEPFMKRMEEMVMKEKEVEVKIEGKMKPKEDDK